MTSDVEMNEANKPLINEDTEKVPEVDFKYAKNEEFRGLTKEELEKFAKDPFWRKIRLVLFILFWLVWAAMLIAAILIVVFSKKCPKRPKLEFWEQKTGYWIDPYAYIDTDANDVGDFKGIRLKLDYIQNQVGAGYIILDPIFKGHYTNKYQKLGMVENFREIDPILGNSESFNELIRESRKRGMEIILTVDFNALSRESAFIKDVDMLIPYNSAFDNWVNRNGNSASIDINGKKYYSAHKSSEMVELNLNHSSVLNEIKDSIKLWLDMGVRGFLLTNIGMYVEKINSITATNANCGNNWYQNQYIGSQIYSNETQNFIKEIRKILDEVAKSTDKSRLLIVDAGDIGIGLNGNDQLLQYVGKKENLADMAIGREFLQNRGWKVKCGNSKSSIDNYLRMIPSDKRKMMGLTAVTSNSPRTNDLLKLVSPFLIEGNPIIYYGSEIGMACTEESNSTNKSVYPESKMFVDVAGEESSRCSHTIMSWDNNGEGFYNNNINKTSEGLFRSKDTVQSLTATGIGETILKLHEKLIKIRKEPSLLWGNTNVFLYKSADKYSYEIFTRQADGFTKIVVALLTDSVNNGKVFSFKSVCDKFTPILIYPSNQNLVENKEIETKNVFLQTSETGSVHVFKCSE